MTPYLDAGFLITLLVVTNGTQIANETLRQIEAPYAVTRLHELQVQAFLTQTHFQPGGQHKQTAAEGRSRWQWYLDQGIFEVLYLDWDAALASATKLAVEASGSPPGPLLILHPVLAAYSGASHFLSFDPRSRGIARVLGLKVLPEEI